MDSDADVHGDTYDRPYAVGNALTHLNVPPYGVGDANSDGHSNRNRGGHRNANGNAAGRAQRQRVVAVAGVLQRFG